MPKIEVTKEERERLLAQRYIISLTTRDWSAEPFVTDRQLKEMPPYMHERFGEPTWKRDRQRAIYVNTRHPINARWVAKERAKEILSLSDDHPTSE